MNYDLEKLKILSKKILERCFSEEPTYINSGVTCHRLANRQFHSSGFSLTLKQWILISNDLPLKKYRKLCSKANLVNSIDIDDLFYKV